jgi:hypothetical protein
MTSYLSDMRTVRPEGPTFRITQPFGLRIWYVGTAQGHCKWRDQILTGSAGRRGPDGRSRFTMLAHPGSRPG